REILRSESLPSAEAAYATVRKEAAHQNILGATNHESQGIAAGLAATEAEAAPDEGDEAFMVEIGIWGEREGFLIPPQKPIYVSDSHSFLK
nr:ribonuclease H-like domain-containing protein [Tanacetum cinerariifolium]